MVILLSPSIMLINVIIYADIYCNANKSYEIISISERFTALMNSKK